MNEKDAQEFLDYYFPKRGVCKELNSYTEWINNEDRRKSAITCLVIRNKRLEGELKLEGFTNLESFDCSGNQITSLKIIGSPNLKSLCCYSNKLTELEVGSFFDLEELDCAINLLTNLNLSQNKKLEKLDISINSFSLQDLSFLSHLVNLKSLSVKNHYRDDLTSSTYNRSTCSLESLKNLVKLKELEITDIYVESSLEYLSLSLDSFIICRPDVWKIEVGAFETELKKFGEPHNDNFILLFFKWRIARVKELEIKVQELQTTKKNFQYFSIFSCLLLAIMGLIWISNGRGIEQRKKKLISRKVNSSF